MSTHMYTRCLNSLSLSVSETDIIFKVKSAAVWFGTLSGKLNKISMLSKFVQPHSVKIQKCVTVHTHIYVHIMLLLGTDFRSNWLWQNVH